MKQEIKDRKVLWIDVETTGTDPEKHGIVQIAGLVEINGEVVEEFDIRSKLLPEDQIAFGSIEATGLDLLEVIEYPDALVALSEFSGIMDKYINKFDKADKFHPAGYNVKFDLDFLYQWYVKLGVPFFRSYVDHITIDVYALVRYLTGVGRMETGSLKLKELIEQTLHIELDGAHDALADIKATRDLALHLNDLYLTDALW